MFLGSLRDVSKESDHERLVFLLIGRALCGNPRNLLSQLANHALAPCPHCLSRLRSSISQEEIDQPGNVSRRNRSRKAMSTISFKPDCCSAQHRVINLTPTLAVGLCEDYKL